MLRANVERGENERIRAQAGKELAALLNGTQTDGQQKAGQKGNGKKKGHKQGKGAADKENDDTQRVSKRSCGHDDRAGVGGGAPRAGMDQAYVQGLRDAKALLDEGIFSEQEFMREKVTLQSRFNPSVEALRVPCRPARRGSTKRGGARKTKQCEERLQTKQREERLCHAPVPEI